MSTFSGKSAVVTGGASGIGRALCEGLGAAGAVVTVADLDGAGAEVVAQGIRSRGGRAQAKPLDVRDAAAVQALVDATADEHGRLDYMFNNAGVAVMGEERDVTAEDWDRVLAIDLHGVVHGTRAAYARMVRQGSGHIVNTASVAGLVPAALEVSYTAAKYGVVGLSHALRAEGARLGVKVSVVCPGFIDTPILRTSPIRGAGDRNDFLRLIPKPMAPERCARVILAGVEANRATIVVTAHAKLLWALARISPDTAIWLSTQVVERVRKMIREGWPGGLLSGRAPPLRCPSMATAPPGTSAPSPFAALVHRDFRYYAAARFLATLAIQMQGLAVGYQVYAFTRSKIGLAYLGLAQFIPIVSLSIAAGQLADKLDRRRILIACDAIFAAAAVALYVLSRSAAPSFGAILALFGLVGAARAFYGPAGSSLLPSLVPREDFTNAVTWHSTLWQVAAIGGPAVGGAIYGIGSAPGPVYLTTAGIVFCAAALVAGIEARPGKGERPPATLETALAGVRYVRRHRILLGSILLDFFAVFLGGATALLPVYASDILHVGPRGLGLMRSAPAVGAGIMAAFLALRPLGRRAGPKMLAGVGLFGLATVIFGVSRSFPLTVAMLVLLGAADMVSVVVRGTLIQAATPPEMRGRVSAVNMMFVGASNELGEFESGVVAEWLGAVPSVVLGGAGTLVVVALWALGFPGIRRVDRLEDVQPETEALDRAPGDGSRARATRS